jgi:DNA helicase-2/ATP-dependent DNA helicase PcrA
MDAWRGGGPAAEQGWIDAGVAPRPKKDEGGGTYREGMLVEHGTYGRGRVTEVSGYGALAKVKIRFGSAGERTFLANKVQLKVVG